MKLIPVKVHSLGLDAANNVPVVLLKDESSNRALPIWIGPAEAAAISQVIDKVAVERPMTHDLIKSILDGLGVTLEKVAVTGLVNGTFLAQLFLKSHGRYVTVDARPSDSIALALRCGAPIFADQELFGQGRSVEPGGDEEDDDLAGRLKKMRPEDFGTAKT